MIHKHSMLHKLCHWLTLILIITVLSLAAGPNSSPPAQAAGNLDESALSAAGTAGDLERRLCSHLRDPQRRHAGLLGRRHHDRRFSQLRPVHRARRRLHPGQRRLYSHLRDPQRRHAGLLGRQHHRPGFAPHRRLQPGQRRRNPYLRDQERRHAGLLGRQRLRPGFAPERRLHPGQRQLGLHTCAIKTTARWPAGATTPTARLRPPAATFTQVSAGGSHTCAIRGDGTLACWGYNATARRLAPTGAFTRVSAGDSTPAGCARRHAGLLGPRARPGLAPHRRLHPGQRRQCSQPARCAATARWPAGARTPTAGLRPPPGTSSVGSAPAILIPARVRSDGTLACWGANTYGRANAPHRRLHPGQRRRLPHLRDPRAAARWPAGATTTTATPRRPAATFTQVSAGWSHTCAIRSDGTLACWGDDARGQARPRPGRFHSQVSAGGYHTCAHPRTTARWPAGATTTTARLAAPHRRLQPGRRRLYSYLRYKRQRHAGLLGQQRLRPGFAPTGAFTQVSAGVKHTCAIRSDGMLACGAKTSPTRLRPRAASSPRSAPALITPARSAATARWPGRGLNGSGQAPRLNVTPRRAAARRPRQELQPGAGRRWRDGPLQLCPDRRQPAARREPHPAGAVSGTPSARGNFAFTVRVVDSWNIIPLSAEKSYVLATNYYVMLPLVAR